MRVLGICGSPRIGGNTETLLDKALEGAASGGVFIEKIILNNLKFCSCQECEKTNEDGTCKIQDDMQGVYEKTDKADAVVFASPIFFGSLSAQSKMMIDRYQCLWTWKYILEKGRQKSNKKPGAFICVEASKKNSFLDNACSIVKNFFAAIDVEYKDELLCKGVDAKGSVLKHPEFLKKAFGLGQKLLKVNE